MRARFCGLCQFIIALGLCVAFARGATADPAQCARTFGPRIKVGTYNLESFYGPPPNATLKAVRPKDPNKIRRQADLLLRHDLDIVVLNELESAAVLQRFNQEYLANRYLTFFEPGNDAKAHHIGFLVRRGLPLLFTYESHRDETWVDLRVSTAAQPLFSRDLPVLTLRDAAAGPTSTPLLIVIGTHFKSQVVRDGLRPEPAREAQVQRTSQIVQRLQLEHGAQVPIILAGDFNANPNHSPEFVTLWRSAHFEDAFNLLPVNPGPAGRYTHTFHPFGRPTRLQQLDAVLLSPPLHRSVVDSVVVRYVDENGREMPAPQSKAQRDTQPSDHFLTYVTLDLTLNSPAPRLESSLPD